MEFKLCKCGAIPERAIGNELFCNKCALKWARELIKKLKAPVVSEDIKEGIRR